jgi:hypothetical protein
MKLLGDLRQVLAPVLKRLVVVNKFEKVELFVEDMKNAMRNTVGRLAVVEGEQLGEVVYFELGFVIDRGSDVAQLERRRVLQAAEAGTRVSENLNTT